MIRSRMEKLSDSDKGLQPKSCFMRKARIVPRMEWRRPEPGEPRATGHRATATAGEDSRPPPPLAHYETF